MSTDKQAVDSFNDQVIRLWTVVYHGNAHCCYSFFDWASVLRSMQSAVASFFDTNIAEKASVGVVDVLRPKEDMHYIPVRIRMDDVIFGADVFRWECDHFTKLHKVLSKCYDQVETDLKLDILSLMSNGN